MATLEKIRSKGVLLLIVVGAALLIFIIGDFVNSGSTYFNQMKANVAKVIAENYNQLRSQIVGNTQYLQLSQTDEDLFHNTLLKVISEGIEDNILEQIEYRIKMLRFQLKMDNKQLKGIYANSEQTEKAKSEESEYQ